jgi:hypothetical protein
MDTKYYEHIVNTILDGILVINSEGSVVDYAPSTRIIHTQQYHNFSRHLHQTFYF